MNNNCLPKPQNIYNSRIESPIQISQNLNYLFYFMPNNSPMFIPNISFCPMYQMPFLQDKTQQQMAMNINNDNNQIPVFYNYSYNNIYSPLNALQFSNSITPSTNTQLHFGPNTPAPPPEDTYFLNKKRSSTVLYEKENEKINVKVKTEEEVIQIKDAQKLKDVSNLENNETKMISNEENDIVKKNAEEKEEIKKEENEKETMVISSVDTEKDKEQIKVEKKKVKKKKRNYTELLQDTLLEHIGEPKKKINTIENEPPKVNTKLVINKSDIKNKNKSKSNKPKTSIAIPNTLLDLDEKSSENTETKEKNKKLKIKSQRNQKKKQHKLTIKNNNNILADLQKDKPNEKNESNSKLTKVIFHGDNYEKTNSMIDFMKYNFDFSIEEQYKTKKLITDYDQQHADFTKIKDHFYENYNYNDQKLENIEQKWSRKKFNGYNKELKKVINIINDTFPGRKAYTNEEKCLTILKDNDYKIDEFLNSRHLN